MPELPEVESVRRCLAACAVGRTVTAVRLRRPDVVRGDCCAAALLAGRRIDDVLRHGKQLALLGTPSGGANGGRPCVCVHLGMTGAMLHGIDRPLPHTHVTWELDGGGELHFRDARRFGGIWTFADEEALRTKRWRSLGPDALVIQPRQLHARLQRTTRALKAALLDQQVVAGLGNIYVDELLHRLRIAPQRRADTLDLLTCQRLVRRMRPLLRDAIAAGGSTLRDFVNGYGEAGAFQQRFRVYGRSGQRCRSCRAPLQTQLVAGRTTVWCGRCQPS